MIDSTIDTNFSPEIIDSTANQVYTVVDPYHFYTFIFDIDLLPLAN